MKTPDTRAEFERNFHLHSHMAQAGKIHIASDLMHTLEGLDRVRTLPNGRIDFLSVDEMARLQVNMMANMMNFVPEEAPTPNPSEEAESGIDTVDMGEKAAGQPPVD